MTLAAQAGEYLEISWATLVQEHGFREPTGFDRGKILVLIQPLEEGLLGHAATPGHIELSSNNFANPDGSLNSGKLKVTTAHELFHLIQYRYIFADLIDPDFGRDRWWRESSAAFIEDIVYDSVDEYVGWLRGDQGFYENLDISLDLQQPKGYPAVLIHRWLAERYGSGSPRVLNVDVIKDVLSRIDRNTDAKEAIDQVLRQRGSTWATAFREFAEWNFRTGNTGRYDPDFYEEGRNYPAVSAFQFDAPPLGPSRIVDTHSGQVAHLAAYYVRLTPDAAITNPDAELWLTLTRQDAQVQATVFRTGTDGRVQTTQIASFGGGNTAQVTVLGFRSQLTREVVLAFSNGDMNQAKQVSYRAEIPKVRITALDPPGTSANGPDFTLTVSGTDFTAQSRVLWNGQERPTTYVSGTTLTAQISRADIASGSPAATLGSAPITVSNPQTTGAAVLSNPVQFTITPAASGPPAIFAITPRDYPYYYPADTIVDLHVFGEHFTAQSVILRDGNSLPTTFISNRELSANIRLGDLPPQPGTERYTIQVRNSGGATSNSATFYGQEGYSQQLYRVSPTSAPVGSGPLTLHVYGWDFLLEPDIQIVWDGVPRATTVVSNTELSTTISAAELAVAGAGPVAVSVQFPCCDPANAVLFTIGSPLPPEIISIDPPSGSTAGEEFVTITGSNFEPGTGVRFGDTIVTDVIVADPSTIWLLTPPHAVGAVTVEVVNPDGQADAASNGYAYAPGGGSLLSTSRATAARAAWPPKASPPRRKRTAPPTATPSRTPTPAATPVIRPTTTRTPTATAVRTPTPSSTRPRQ